MNDIQLAIVEDNPGYRASLKTLFEQAPGFSVVDSFGSADRALSEVRDRLRLGEPPPWNLVLMDIEIPGTGGIEATRQLKQLLPGISVVMLTVFEEPATILSTICAGADGYLLKKSSARDLIRQLRSVHAGGAPLTPGVARTVVKLLRATGGDGASPGSGTVPMRQQLTERRQEVLRLLTRGMSYQQVADEMGISIDTVRTHIRGIYKTLQVHSVAEAVSRAIREGLV